MFILLAVVFVCVNAYILTTQGIREPFEVANDYYDMFVNNHVFITLSKRRDNIRRFAESLDFQPNMFPAPIASSLDVQKLIGKNYLHEDFALEHERPFIACVLSHVLLMEQLLLTNKPFLVIFEDDVVPIDSMDYKLHVRHNKTKVQNVIRHVMKAIDSKLFDWDIIYLGKCDSDCPSEMPVTKYINKVVIKFACTHAYIVSRAGAQKIFSNLPFTKKVDLWFHDLPLLCYTTRVSLFAQYRSSISSMLTEEEEMIMSISSCAHDPTAPLAFV